MSQEKSNAEHASQNSEPEESTASQSGDDPEQESSSPSQDTTRPMAPYSASEAGGPVPQIDEGPRPGPVDEIQQALFEAAQADLSTDVELEGLTPPSVDLDDEPRVASVDDVQQAIAAAAQEGKTTEIDFDALPEPTLAPAQKVIKFDTKPLPPTEPAAEPDVPAEPEPEPKPEPDLKLAPPEPGPMPTLSDFWFLLVLFVTFRLFTLFLLRPGGFVRDWSDFNTFFGIASLSDYGLFPYLDFWLEWPPLVPWLTVGAYQLALLLPPWTDDPRLWFILILGSVFVLFEIGNFVLIYHLAKRLFETPATINRILWIYAGLFPPIYAMLGFFDGIALFFVLAALALIIADRRFISAMVIGVGFMVKIIPILMLPVALRRLWYQYRADNRGAGIEAGLYIVVFGLTVLVFLAPFLIYGPEWVMASVRSMFGRSSWETVWAVFEGYYGFGAVAGDRLNPAETNFAVHPGGLPGGLPWRLISLVFLAIYAFVFIRPANYARPRNIVAFAGLTVAIFLLYAKGYSPQFLVYMLPFILLLLPTGQGLTYALVLTGLNILEQPVYFVLLPNETWLLTFVVITRWLVTLILALEFGLMIWPLEERLPALHWVQERAALIVGGIGILALIVLIPLMLNAYTASQLVDSPIGTFTGFLKATADDSSTKPRILLSDQATYRQLYPYLRQTAELELADGATRFEAAATVRDLTRGLDQVWILPTGSEQQALRNSVAATGDLLGAYDFEGLGTASLYTFRRNAIPTIAPARFVGGIELLDNHIEVDADAVEVALYWRALEPQTQELKVFTQILNEENELVAGHDSVPGNGTAPITGWNVDAVQADIHRISLPPNLQPGEYSVIIGLYNDFNQRVRGIDPEGSNYPSQAVFLGTIELPGE